MGFRPIDTPIDAPWTYEERSAPSFPPGVSFAGSFTDYAVLQKGASHAAVYGAVTGGVSSSLAVTVALGGAKTRATIVQMDRANGTAVWKALLPPHREQGGDYTLSAQCTGCDASNGSTVVLQHVTFGDVIVCSGQSNMELPMQHALTRNRTYERLAAGEYSNIRTFKHASHDARMDGDEQWLLPPPPPPGCPDADGTPHCYGGWRLPNASTTDEFSAACWFTAQELTDIALAANRTAPVIGLIQSAWGGTEIEVWLRNSTNSACANATGGPTGTKGVRRQSASPTCSSSLRACQPLCSNGALWNGMVAPFINMTIWGALW